MDSEVIKSTLKVLSSKKVYNFSVDKDQYQIETTKVKKTTVITKNEKVIHNLDTITAEVKDGESTIEIQQEKFPLLGKTNIVSIWFNKIPLENSYADPFTRAKVGYNAYSLLLVLFLFKIFLAPLALILTEGGDYLSNLALSLMVYGLPFIAIIVFFALFKKFYKVALIVGLVIMGLELIDYFYSVITNPMILLSNMTYFYLIMRGGIIFCLIFPLYSLSQLKKRNKGLK